MRSSSLQNLTQFSYFIWAFPDFTAPREWPENQGWKAPLSPLSDQLSLWESHPGKIWKARNVRVSLSARFTHFGSVTHNVNKIKCEKWETWALTEANNFPMAFCSMDNGYILLTHLGLASLWSVWTFVCHGYAHCIQQVMQIPVPNGGRVLGILIIRSLAMSEWLLIQS